MSSSRLQCASATPSILTWYVLCPHYYAFGDSAKISSQSGAISAATNRTLPLCGRSRTSRIKSNAAWTRNSCLSRSTRARRSPTGSSRSARRRRLHSRTSDWCTDSRGLGRSCPPQQPAWSDDCAGPDRPLVACDSAPRARLHSAWSSVAQCNDCDGKLRDKRQRVIIQLPRKKRNWRLEVTEHQIFNDIVEPNVEKLALAGTHPQSARQHAQHDTGHKAPYARCQNAQVITGSCESRRLLAPNLWLRPHECGPPIPADRLEAHWQRYYRSRLPSAIGGTVPILAKSAGTGSH